MRRESSRAGVVAGVLFALARRWRRRRDGLQAWGRSLRKAAGLEDEPRVLAPRPWMAQGTRSSQRINELLRIVGTERYLEIGVESGYTLAAVQARLRIAVDPAPRFHSAALPRGVALHPVPSDAYFAAFSDHPPLDGAFIDGLHEFRQTYRDLLAAIALLAPGGFALVDDVVPTDEIAGIPSEEEFRAAAQRAGRHGGAWMGDVWRVVLLLDRCHQGDLDWRTVTARNGRLQTLVWRNSVAPVTAASHDDLRTVSAVQYAEAMAPGVPDSFRPASWRDAVAAFRAGRVVA